MKMMITGLIMVVSGVVLNFVSSTILMGLIALSLVLAGSVAIIVDARRV